MYIVKVYKPNLWYTFEYEDSEYEEAKSMYDWLDEDIPRVELYHVKYVRHDELLMYKEKERSEK